MEKELLVSVCMITYGHEKYISEALLGVAFQKTNFNIELIIADDCSPDKTEQKVARAIHLLKMKNVRYTKHSQNKGMMPNFIWALAQCQGKYIALCEGDDYWTDPLKLQKQIDYLEAHPDFVASFHQGSNFYQDSKRIEDFIKETSLLERKITPKDIIRLGGNLCPTNSIVFRNHLLEFPSFFREAKSGDRALCLLLMERGKFHFINDNMSTYRVHSEGVSRNLTREQLIAFKESNIEVLSAFNSHSNYHYQRWIRTEISSQIRNIFIYNPHYLFKKNYLKRISSKHLTLSLTRIAMNTFSIPFHKSRKLSSLQ